MAHWNIACEGDSIMQGYPLAESGAMPYQLNQLLQARPGADTYSVINDGQANRTMVTMDSRYAASMAPLYDAEADHNVFLLWGGGNDIYFYAGQQAAAIAAFDSLVSKCLATGWRVLVLNIIQRGLNASGTIATWRTEAAAINAHFAGKAGIEFVDIRSVYTSYRWEDDPWTSPDSTHASVTRPPEYYDWAHPDVTGHASNAAYVYDALGLPSVNDIRDTTGNQAGIIKTINGQDGGIIKTFNGSIWH